MTTTEHFLQQHNGVVRNHGVALSSASRCVACRGKILLGTPWISARYQDASGFRTARFHVFCTPLERALALAPHGSRISNHVS